MASRSGSTSRHTAPDAAIRRNVRRAVGDGLRRALKRRRKMEVYRLSEPLRLEIDLRLAAMADYCAVMPGVERTGPRSVAAQPADADEHYRYMIAIVRMASIPG